MIVPSPFGCPVASGTPVVAALDSIAVSSEFCIYKPSHACTPCKIVSAGQLNVRLGKYQLPSGWWNNSWKLSTQVQQHRWLGCRPICWGIYLF